MVHHSFWVTKKYSVTDGKTMHLFIGLDALSMTQAIEAISGKSYKELNVKENSHESREFTTVTEVGETHYLVEQRDDRPTAPKDQPWSVIDGRSGVKEQKNKGYQLKFS